MSSDPDNSQKHKRGFWGTVWDSLFERYPEAKPWREYLAERIGVMRLKKWIALLLVGVVLIITAARLSYQIALHHRPPVEKIVKETNFVQIASLPSPQWYLKINHLQLSPPIDQPLRVPFRIEAIVSGQPYSVPHSWLFFSGITNRLDCGESFPLRREPEKYDVQFFGMASRRQMLFGGTNIDALDTNTVASVSIVEEISIRDLPIRKTNYITMIRPEGEVLNIAYEITTNW
ncbi:MAG: hypothetical protein ABSE90_10790 [Verrucomicrobiota bacterium]|jgi:hypothetical protein